MKHQLLSATAITGLLIAGMATPGQCQQGLPSAITAKSQAIIQLFSRYHETNRGVPEDPEVFAMGRQFERLMNEIPPLVTDVVRKKIETAKDNDLHARIAWIAIERSEHRQRFDEIFSRYLRHPSREHVRAGALRIQEQLDKLADKPKYRDDNGDPVDPFSYKGYIGEQRAFYVLSPPLLKKHVTKEYLPCFEYYTLWIRNELVYRGDGPSFEALYRLQSPTLYQLIQSEEKRQAITMPSYISVYVDKEGKFNNAFRKSSFADPIPDEPEDPHHWFREWSQADEDK